MSGGQEGSLGTVKTCRQRRAEALSTGPDWVAGLSTDPPWASVSLGIKWGHCEAHVSVPVAWQARTEDAIPGPDASVPWPRVACFARRHFLGENGVV